MILFLILILLLAASLLMLRSQSRRQHREMMSAVNPERLAELDAAAHSEARKQWTARLGIVAAFIVVGFLFWGCNEIPKLWHHETIEAQP